MKDTLKEVFDNFKECIVFVLLVVLTVVGVVAFSIIMIVGPIYYAVENVPVVVKKDGIKVYEGRSACVAYSCNGKTTKVSIGEGFLCMFPKAHYVGENITIEGSK